MEKKKYVDFDKVITTYKTFGHLNLHNALEAFNEIPAADVRQVVHGKWKVCDWVEYDGHEEYIHYPREGLCCTNRRHVFKKELLWKENFCPNCGANMKEAISE